MQWVEVVDIHTRKNVTKCTLILSHRFYSSMTGTLVKRWLQQGSYTSGPFVALV